MGSKYNYDYIVIGSGAAGGAAALMAGGAGLKVAIIEADRWGGSTINYRDVPYAAGLHFSHLYSQAVQGARFGLSSTNLHYNYPTATSWRLIAAKRAGAGSKKDFEKVGITCIKGYAHFISGSEVTVGEHKLTAKKFLIATGATPQLSGITGIDTIDYLTPDTALLLKKLPASVLVVGAGSAGCEVAQYFAELGVQVVLVEAADHLLPREDVEAGQVIQDYFSKKQNIKVLTGAKVVAVSQDDKGKKITVSKHGKETSIHLAEVVFATGKLPATDLGLENAGVKYDPVKGIKVDKMLKTSAHHIYAAGDVTGGESSTEKASYQAAIATSSVVNHGKSTLDGRYFIRATNTFPQVASIGLTEKLCIERKLKYSQTLVPLSAVTASNTQDFRSGFLKLVINREHKIIGATVVSPFAALVIQEISLAIKAELKPLDLAATPHVSSDWGELVRLAARRLSK